MSGVSFDDLGAFMAVAEERSFTRAAVKLGVSQSALSQTIRGLEARVGIRLLARTTRSVALTEAGDRLLRTARPRLEEISAELAALGELQHKPAGTIRLTCTENAAEAVLWPVLERLLPDYPDIKVEIVIDYGLSDVVADRCDAGVRFGGQVGRDMIAVRIGPDIRMAVVASPSYFAKHPAPKIPQDLTVHDCINLRLPSRGLYAWEFGKGGRELRVRVDGQLVFNSTTLIRNAAVCGLGLAHLPEQQVRSHLDSGELVRVLTNWCAPFTGYHLYYPSRRQPSAAFALLVDALRYPAKPTRPRQESRSAATS